MWTIKLRIGNKYNDLEKIKIVKELNKKFVNFRSNFVCLKFMMIRRLHRYQKVKLQNYYNINIHSLINFFGVQNHCDPTVSFLNSTSMINILVDQFNLVEFS